MAADPLLFFVLAGLLLNLTPGPDVLYIVSSALRHGARAGSMAALGITAGCFVHILAAAVGLSALLAASGTAFVLLKWLGAAYLLYAGARLIFFSSPFATKLGAAHADQTVTCAIYAPKAVFFGGFWTNALNPKVALFFLAFLPQFIAPAVQHKPLAFLLLGLLFNFNALCVNLAWALAAAALARRLAAVQRGMRWVDRAAGSLFVAFGLKLAWFEPSAT